MLETLHFGARCLLLSLFLYSYCGFAQTAVDGMHYERFRELVERNSKDTMKSSSYAEAWLDLAKTESNFRQQALAYKVLLHLTHLPGRKRIYADSMLMAARKANDHALIGAAHISRGMLLFDKNKQGALDAYLSADKHIAKTSDRYAQYKVRYVIAQTKFNLGFYDEAISLLKQCLEFYRSENERAYLNTLHALSLCYNRKGEIEESSRYNRKGLAEASEFSNDEMNIYFYLSEAVNEYGRKKFKKSIYGLDTLVRIFVSRNDVPNTTVANYYLANNYWALGQYDKAIPYLKKVDTVFSTRNYVRPELRRNYELLIDYYKKNGDHATKDYYVERLLRADKILDEDYKYLSKRIFKSYDTRRLMAELHETEKSGKRILYYIIAVMSVALVVSVVGYVLNKRRTKRYFMLAMARDPETEKHQIEKVAKQTRSLLSPDLAASLLSKLSKWEEADKFLERNCTSTKLAGMFHTNPKYISELIRHYRGKRFTEYVNDLRIDHVVELLKTQSKFRNYTNEALASEGGFGSTQIFTRAFKKRVKISPTTFISELEDISPTSK